MAEEFSKEKKEYLAELFNGFKTYPKMEKEETIKTFLGVSGYPHYENVCSNILAFFLDAREQHGMKDLFLKSLFEATYGTNTYLLDDIDIQITREKGIEKGRLDIFLDTPEISIIIENKIYAPLNNDLKNYYDSIKKNNKKDEKNNKKVVLIVLYLRDLEKYTEIKGRDIQYLSYDLFFNKVQANMGEYLCGASAEWVIFLKNFIQQINLLDKGEEGMVDFSEQVQFFSNYSEAIFEMNKELKKLVNHFSSQMGKIMKIMKEDLPGYDFKVWNSEKYYVSSVWHVVKSPNTEEGFFERFQVVRCLNGWEFIINSNTSPRRKDDIEKKLEEVGFSIQEEINGHEDAKGWIPIWVCKNEKASEITEEKVAEKVAKEAVKIFKKLINV